ncbi:MAG: DUF5686 and carboxypeptidase regulatory-like domain-containing protein [Cyclobacteriaceae bacterium]
MPLFLFLRTLVIHILLLSTSTMLFAGGIKGTVKADDGTPLAFATIFVKQTGSGAVTGLEGQYEVTLLPGNYDITFQYLGYEAVTRSVTIAEDFIELNLTLKSQAIVLQNVIITAGNEDPAYTIMRKTISKAKYHTQQIDTYSAKVYIKGKGRLKDYPWLAKKALEKEGITKDRLFISESVSEVAYTRPNKFEEKVIAVYSDGNDNNTSPNEYVFGSFYEPEIAETISPLSPRAFSYYRFEYLGTFTDRDYSVSKIRVTPRSKGDNVFEGVLFIVEDWWSIHSLDFKVMKLGIDFEVKQIYNPIEDKAWLPVSQQFKVDGKVFGFGFEYNYLATVKDYKIVLNPDLELDMKVIDEKIEKEYAKEIKTQFSAKDQDLRERLEDGKEITNKELRKLIKDYEKDERKETDQPEVISDTKYSVDSLAFKKDSVFWADIRPIALTIEEIKGYKKSDSLAEVEKKKQEGDTLKSSKHKGFQPWDILIGDNYKLSETSNFLIHSPWGGFNTVEGLNLIYKLGYVKRWVERDSLDKTQRPNVKRLEVTPIARYAFGREQLTGILRADYRSTNSRLTIEGGRYVKQFNADEPIHPFVNTFTTLFLEKNLMKLYEQDFIQINYRQRLDAKFTVTTNWSIAKRYELFNSSDFKLINRDKEAYTPNVPINQLLVTTGFQNHNALIGSIAIEARPWQKFRIRNGRRYSVKNSSPLFTISYKKGFKDALNSDVDFDLIEVGYKQSIRVGIRGKLDVALKGGKFINTNKMYFMDYAHFLGNQTPFITTDPVGSFRLLDYYLYSTRDKYFTGNAHYHFRKFLITQFPLVRLTGVTENVFVNYLASPLSNDYTELGYSLDGILRIFRLEGAVSFSGGSYQTYGFRIGVATSVGVNFD